MQSVSLEDLSNELERNKSTDVITLTFQRLGLTFLKELSLVEFRDSNCVLAEPLLSKLYSIHHTISIWFLFNAHACNVRNLFSLLQCQKVKKFSKLVYVYVKAGIPKHRICRFKKICRDEKKPRQNKKPVEKKNKTKFGDRKSVKQSTLCKACKIVMGTVEFGVKLFNYTEQKTIAFIESLCKLSPLTIQYKVVS